MIRKLTRRGVLLVAGGSALAAVAATPSHGQTVSPAFRRLPGVAEAPFGDRVGPVINNYNRASPYVATAGLLFDGGVAEAKRLGFQLILDLRGQNERGVREEAGIAGATGIRYLNIPFTTWAPTLDQVALFSDSIEDTANYPVLVHCVSSNRSGAMWALYRASKSVPKIIAIEEGQATGLTGRENAVRKMLGLAQL